MDGTITDEEPLPRIPLCGLVFGLCGAATEDEKEHRVVGAARIHGGLAWTRDTRSLGDELRHSSASNEEEETGT
ncbi:hypothetical protein EJB05_28689 [Eragrostis curvula]|uniref:Uncharacterized protein n=1 Tax=Eragrostis curvula TaxID=38414 RepID=A0A5J9UQW8_9POAL|nr:hypothetical protein EJB05_28689 [Eragrostis curvula]